MSPLYVLRGTALGLAWLVLVNAMTSAIIAQMTPRVAASSGVRPPAFWLALRLLPSGISLTFALLVFAPSYWWYEPRVVGEAFDVTLIALAIAALVLLAVSIVRGAAAWRAASRRMRAWTQVGRPFALDQMTLPMVAVDAAPPIMALGGVFRPRLIVTRGVLDALTVEELRACVAHELGHWRARDNLKRLAMRAAPDLLGFSSRAATLESRWASAAEHAADRHACEDERSRCALASALVKVARLRPPATPLAEPMSTLVDGGEIAMRVEQLLSDMPPSALPPRRWAIAAAALAAVVAYGPLLHIVHEATEILVRTLP